MKQYLLTEDQIERMLACAIKVGEDANSDKSAHESYVMIEQNYLHPLKNTHHLASTIFNRIKDFEIILPIENN